MTAPRLNAELLIKEAKKANADYSANVTRKNGMPNLESFTGMEADINNYTTQYEELWKLLNQDPKAEFFNENHIEQCNLFIEATRTIMMKRYPEINAYPQSLTAHLAAILNMIKTTQDNGRRILIRDAFQKNVIPGGMRYIDYIRVHIIQHLYKSVMHDTLREKVKGATHIFKKIASRTRKAGIVEDNKEIMHPLLKRMKEIFPPKEKNKKSALKFHIESASRIATTLNDKQQEFLTHRKTFADKKALLDYLNKTFIRKLKANIPGLPELTAEEIIHQLSEDKFITAIPVSIFPIELRVVTELERNTYLKTAMENVDEKQSCNVPPREKEENYGLIFDKRHKTLVSQVCNTLEELRESPDMTDPASYKSVFLNKLPQSFIKFSFYNAARKTVIQASKDHAAHLNATSKTSNKTENDKWSFVIAKFATHLWEYHDTAPKTPQASTTGDVAKGTEEVRRSNAL